jgi:hypothetical protein
MRCSAAFGMAGPTSFMNSEASGVFGTAARNMPISPPIEVPIQCTRSTSSRASSAVTSAWYCAYV